MLIRFSPSFILYLSTVLTLAACATSNTQDLSSVSRSEAEQQQAFHSLGFVDKDLATIAALINNDLPTALAQFSSNPVTVLVRESDVRSVDDNVIIDRHAFASRLLAELQRHTNNVVSYAARNDGTGMADRNSMSRGDDGKSRDSRSGNMGRGLGGGRSSKNSATEEKTATMYLMEVAVSRTTDTAYPNAQNYTITVREHLSGKPIWQGSFLIDAPAKP